MTTLISWQLSNTSWITVVAPAVVLLASVPATTVHSSHSSQKHPFKTKSNHDTSALKILQWFPISLGVKVEILTSDWKSSSVILASSASPLLAHPTHHMAFAHDFPLPGVFLPQTRARLTLSLSLVASQTLSYQRDLFWLYYIKYHPHPRTHIHTLLREAGVGRKYLSYPASWWANMKCVLCRIEPQLPTAKPTH